jgi:hypothetical protein
MDRYEIPQHIRQILVQEIELWLKQGQITPAQRDVLRHFYDFDFESPPVPEVKPIEPPAPMPAPTQVRPITQVSQDLHSAEPKLHLTLAQTLLSETSIRIALYLGAFFVIAAALILAALVADLRLPILSITTICFAAGALILKRRLPQPSFILFLVFSALLPITCGVLADLLNLTGTVLTRYWLFVTLGMTVIWGFSTRLYSSRFFSVTAMLALDAAMILCGSLAHKPELSLFLFLLSFCSLAGVGAAYLLKRWRGRRMAIPVFILAQIQQFLIAGLACFTLLLPNHDLFTATTFLLTSVIAVLCNLLYPYVLYPWVAAGALMPVAWLVVRHFDGRRSISAITFSAWGTLYLVAGNLLSRLREHWRSYALPASVIAIPLLLTGSLLGLAESSWLCFGVSLGAAIALSLSHIFHRRVWLWIIALGFGLGAYLSLIQSIAKAAVPYWSAQLAGATLLLLLPEMLVGPKKLSGIWRWPLRGWAILTGTMTLATGMESYYLGAANQARAVVFTLGVVALLYLAYAISIRQPWLGAFFSMHLALSIVFGLQTYHVDNWLPSLTCLSVLFFGGGIFVKWLKRPRWSLVIRWSGLLLGGILSVAAFAYAGPARALYVFVIAFIFLYETLQTHWLEVVPPIIISFGFGLALYDANVEWLAYYSAGIAGVFLTLDLLYMRLERTGLRWVTRSIGGLMAFLTPILVFVPRFEPIVGTITCISLAAICMVEALAYYQFELGYPAAIFLTLSVLFTDLYFASNRWLWSMIVMAIVFYGASILPGRLKQTGWRSVLCNSGLGLASLTAMSASFERSGLIASLPVALAATLWAAEAWRRRNVWLGLPANALYLMAYFMILATLRVEEVQFYSVGAALLGMLMHYLLVRSGSKTGAFVMGMISQLVLIGTTYIQFVDTESIWYFAVMFFQSLIVLAYGIVIRSKSLVITPIILVIIGVATVVFGALRGFSTVILVGTTGIGLIVLGIIALLLRERITNLRDLLRNWRA